MTVKRCFLHYLTFEGQSRSCLVQQCRIENFRPDNLSENLYVQNTAIRYIASNNSDGATLLFENCTFTNHNRWSIATYKNCLLRYPTCHDGSAFYYNVYVGTLDAGIQEHNMQVKNNSDSEYLALFDGTLAWSGTVKLTDEAAAKYLGSDGTQVGVYGGEIGFTDVPSNPQILSKNIATKSEDGKLSIKISVEAQD